MKLQRNSKTQRNPKNVKKLVRKCKDIQKSQIETTKTKYKTGCKETTENFSIQFWLY